MFFIALASLAVSVAGLGYSVYAGNQAAKASRDQMSQQQQQAQQQQAQQQDMLAKQTAAQQALAAQQQAQQQATQAANAQAQKDALAAAQAQIPVNQAALSQSLSDSQKQSMMNQEPLIEGRLNALGLLQSGALPAQQAKYQADLASQAQTDLTNYGVNANTAIQNQALAYTGQDTQNLQQDLQTTLANQQAAMNQQFQSQDTAYQNNVAQSQYLANLQAANNFQAQQQANAIGGGIMGLGQAGLGFAGQYARYNQSPAAQPQTAASYFNPSQNYSMPSTPTYGGGNSGVAFDPFSSTGMTQSPGSYFTAPSQVGQVGSYDAYGNFTGPASSPIAPYTPWTPYTGGT